MTATMEIEVDVAKLRRAVLAAPERLERHLDRAIERTAQSIARDARRAAPKAFSTLTQSIGVSRPSRLEAEIGPSVTYGRMVEEGTGTHGPAGAPFGAVPPVENILDWVTVARVTPRDPTMEPEDLAWAIARHIAETGTPPQPYLAPAFEDNKRLAERLLSAAIDLALQ